MFYKYKSILVSFLAVLFFFDISFSYDLSQLPGNIDFNKLKDQLIDTVKHIGTYKASEAFDEIEKNLKSFKTLQLKIRNAKNVDSVIDEVAQSLRNMSKSYSKIAKMKYEVFADYNIREKQLATIDGKIIDTVDGLKEKLLEIKSDDIELRNRLNEEQNRKKKNRNDN